MTDSKSNTTFTGNDEVQIVNLIKQPVDLYKILKFEGLVGSGGEAKSLIAGGRVILNNVVETQKRKKIISGDIIEFNDSLYRMHCDEPLELMEPGAATKDENDVEDAANPVRKPAVKTQRKKTVPKKAGRKAIGIKS